MIVLGEQLIQPPPVEQSDWLECYNHGTNNTACTDLIPKRFERTELWSIWYTSQINDYYGQCIHG